MPNCLAGDNTQRDPLHRSALAPAWIAICAISLAGCASPSRQETSERLLAARLHALHPAVSSAEATLAAQTSHAYSLQLAGDYRVVRPPCLHNTFVNLGLRKRGLCYHWADDLSAKLHSLNLRTLELHRAVARRDTRREHNSVVLVAPGQPFYCGIVLDAWRRSGRLYWGDVASDKYPWTDLGAMPALSRPQAAAPQRQAFESPSARLRQE